MVQCEGHCRRASHGGNRAHHGCAGRGGIGWSPGASTEASQRGPRRRGTQMRRVPLRSAGAGVLLGLVVLFAPWARVWAGIADTPLPRFADGKQSVLVRAVTGVVKRGGLETDFLCTSFDSEAVNIGVEVFGVDGVRLNDVSTGSGALLAVGPGQTVTIGTGGTAA